MDYYVLYQTKIVNKDLNNDVIESNKILRGYATKDMYSLPTVTATDENQLDDFVEHVKHRTELIKAAHNFDATFCNDHLDIRHMESVEYRDIHVYVHPLH